MLRPRNNRCCVGQWIRKGVAGSLIRTRFLDNITNIGRKLHEPLWGVPRAVREYIDETRAQLRMIAQEHDIPLQEKLAFLQETRHCFGRTALLLSGGGTLGTFHVGVARALNARGCLPRVVAGSSVGSIVAAIMASRTPDELEEFFSEKHFWAGASIDSLLSLNSPVFYLTTTIIKRFLPQLSLKSSE